MTGVPILYRKRKFLGNLLEIRGFYNFYEVFYSNMAFEVQMSGTHSFEAKCSDDLLLTSNKAM